MSLQIMAMSAGWLTLLYQMLNQYNYCKQTYNSQDIKLCQIYETDKKQKKKLQTIQNLQVFEKNDQKQQGKNSLQQNNIKENESSHKVQENKQRTEELITFNQENYIVFPEQYPNLKTKKIKKDAQSQKRKRTKLKKKAKQYKKLFLSNQVLNQLCKNLNYTQNQFQTVYPELSNNTLQENHHQNFKSYSLGSRLTKTNQSSLHQQHQEIIEEEVPSYNPFI